MIELLKDNLDGLKTQNEKMEKNRIKEVRQMMLKHAETIRELRAEFTRMHSLV